MSRNDLRQAKLVGRLHRAIDEAVKSGTRIRFRHRSVGNEFIALDSPEAEREVGVLLEELRVVDGEVVV